jgi:hypothetical protein
VHPRLFEMGLRNFDIDENCIRDLQNTKLGYTTQPQCISRRLASEMTNVTTHSKLRAKNLIIRIKLETKNKKKKTKKKGRDRDGRSTKLCKLLKYIPLVISLES